MHASQMLEAELLSKWAMDGWMDGCIDGLMN
jgi:hypothetical protein